MPSEIVFLITEQRNKQRITLPSGRGSYRFGRSAQCEYVLRRNNVGDRQFTIACAGEQWTVTDDASDCNTWYNNRYLAAGETCPLQPGDVIGLNTDGTQLPRRSPSVWRRSALCRGSVDGPRQEQTDAAVLREIDVRRKSGC